MSGFLWHVQELFEQRDSHFLLRWMRQIFFQLTQCSVFSFKTEKINNQFCKISIFKVRKLTNILQRQLNWLMHFCRRQKISFQWQIIRSCRHFWQQYKCSKNNLSRRDNLEIGTPFQLHPLFEAYFPILVRVEIQQILWESFWAGISICSKLIEMSDFNLG